MSTRKNLPRTGLRFGALVIGLAVASCQTAKEKTASAEPTATEIAPASVEQPKVHAATSLGSNPDCRILVTAKSPDAVADPCMTTEKFVQTIAALTSRQKQQALKMIAASTQLLQRLGARVAH